MGSGQGSVSVVIPVWDSYVEFLPEAIRSAFQAIADPQVIVVDNASDPPIGSFNGCEVLRSEVRLSRGAARNLGLSRVEAEYVVFLDADDLVLAGKLSPLLGRLDIAPDVQAAIGGIVESDGSRHRTPRRLARLLSRSPRIFRWANAVWSLAPTQGCAVMRTAAVRDCGGYVDASIAEDWALGVSLTFRGRIAFDPDPVLLYRLRPDSPGEASVPWPALLGNAARVRERVRTDPKIPAGPATLATLAAAQVLAAGVAPVVRELRRLRNGRVPGGARWARDAREARDARGQPEEPIRVVRVIARLNIGGPAIQAITLTRRLQERGYRTTLIRGREGAREGSMDDLAAELGVKPVLVADLRRDPGRHDLVALAALVRILRRERPQIVHTHAAKAGTLGRLATLIAFPRRRNRPVLVHTFHGHSLTGYFSPRVAGAYRTIERVLARRTDALVAVSAEVRDELVALGVADSARFSVIALGFDLDRFVLDAERADRARATVRQELHIPPDATLITLIARLVPIKRVDRFLRTASEVVDVDNAHFLVVGDGELHDSLRASPEAQSLGSRLVWAGFRRDIPEVCAASDLMVLTSDNEGTPVSLIEAGAAGLPSVGTRVGGAATVIRDGETGVLVSPDDVEQLAITLRRLAGDPELRARMGAAAQNHVLQTFSIDRLIADVDDLYRSLLPAGATAA